VLLLKGVRVLDLSRVLAGPYATMVLADLGADVIKVEHPERGDDTRHWGPPFAGGESAYFLSVNRNKRSITADLKNKEDLDRIKQFAAKADVLIENFRRGTLGSFGMDYQSLRRVNPAIIYCSITGFGPGKDQDRPGYDFLVQARGGLMGITGHSDGEPAKVGVAVADVVCGLFAANTILAALYRRSLTGQGTCLEVPLFESQLAWLANRAQEYLVSGVDTGRMGNEHPSIVPYETFAASDKLIAIAVGNDQQFVAFCRALGRDDLARDPRFATNPERVTNREVLVRVLKSEIIKRPAAEWIETIQESGVPCGPVNSLADVFSDPHLASSGMLQELTHPTAGLLKMLASPLLVDGERPPIRRPPPLLGQHTAGLTPDNWY
jgi:crotonobetainyl-CoA:carnitine CoA-transferase CaiB-like acyl-CoA transferase